MDKQSEAFRNLTNDVRAHREVQWASIFHQLRVPVARDDVNSILEFGPGRGLAGAVLKHYGFDYTSADVRDFGARPDTISTIMDYPADRTFDLVCAFQVLEHNPPETLLPHMEKMASLANRYVYVSLPFAGRWIDIALSLRLPRVERRAARTLAWNRLWRRPRPIETYRASDTPHRWHWFEVGDIGFTKADIVEIAGKAGLATVERFHVRGFPYHVFFLFEKLGR